MWERVKPVLNDYWLIIVIVAVLAAVVVYQAVTSPPNVTVQALDAQLNSGKPVVLHFYSNF